MTPIVHITDKERDLQAQLDHSRACVQQMSRLNELMVAELAEARVELDRIKPDAERYQWWSAAISKADMDYLEKVFKSIPTNGPIKKQDLDAAIDAARKEQS